MLEKLKEISKNNINLLTIIGGIILLIIFSIILIPNDNFKITKLNTPCYINLENGYVQVVGINSSKLDFYTSQEGKFFFMIKGTNSTIEECTGNESETIEVDNKIIQKKDLKLKLVSTGKQIFNDTWIIGNYSIYHGKEKVSKSLALCIGEKSKLYTQLGCHACINQEKLFGNNYKYLNVTDCFYKKEECINKNITATPSWIINGEMYNGIKQIEELKELTGCF